MEQKGFVGKIIKKKGSRAIVQPLNIDDSTKSVDAFNSLKAKVDNIVQVEYQYTSKQKDLVLLIAPPIFSTLAGALLGYRLQSRLGFPVEECILYGALIWLFLALIYSFQYWRYSYGRGMQAVIVKIRK